jgi:catechol 2,3-dioxygenase-like lactoylglutathione lyase family enzyme
VQIHGISELTLETRAQPAMERFYVDVLGLRELAREDADPEGNVVELWDYFVDGEGAHDGVEGLRD